MSGQDELSDMKLSDLCVIDADRKVFATWHVVPCDIGPPYNGVRAPIQYNDVILPV